MPGQPRRNWTTQEDGDLSVLILFELRKLRDVQMFACTNIPVDASSGCASSVCVLHSEWCLHDPLESTEVKCVY